MDRSSGVIHRLSRRAVAGLTDLAWLTLYFWSVFATMLFFKATTLHAYGIRYVDWGAAIIKAVFIAKFMLIGRPIKIVSGCNDVPLIRPIIYRTIFFFFLLLALTCVEEGITGLLHHQSISTMYHTVSGSERGETIAETLILLLALVPVVALSVFSEALGQGKLRQMLFEGGNPR